MKPNFIKHLQDNEGVLIEALKKVILANNFDYRTLGTAIEPFMVEIVINELSKGGFIKKPEDYKVAENKNEFPDLTFNMPDGSKIAVEIKSGNHSRKKGSQWQKTKNSENDMGTLNEWPKKIKKFGGDNIFYLFIEYNFNETDREIIGIKIDNFYRFLGVNGGGVLKYREKDGNLRPRDFLATPPIDSFEKFIDLFDRTGAYRSKNIITKHIQNIPKDERDDFLSSLVR